MNQPQEERKVHWPLWMRTFAGLGALGTLVTGFCILFVPGFEIRGANQPAGSGLKLTGTAAVLTGLGVIFWSLVFSAYVLFPNAPVWTRKWNRNAKQATPSEQDDDFNASYQADDRLTN